MTEVLPDPGNALSGYKYLLQEAGKGMFDETSDLLVAVYLWTHAWRKTPNPDDYPIGWVQSEHTSVGAITKGTMLGRNTVIRALGRLREHGWIETELIGGDDWRLGQNIWVRIDPEGHQARHLTGATMTPDWAHHDTNEPNLSSFIYKEQVDGGVTDSV